MAESKYSLTLYEDIAQGTGFVDDITHKVENWNRSTRFQGGYWMGDFRVKGKLADLQDWFYNRLGYHVQERAGGAISWEGLIYEMELSTPHGVKRRRSLDDMRNAVRAHYAKDNGDVLTTDWSTQAQSIARYGRREDTLSDTFVSPANAATMVTRSLSETAWPWPRCTGFTPATEHTEAQLDVTVAGYVWTINWRYMPDTWSADAQIENDVKVKISDWFATVFADATLCPFVEKGRIDENSIEVTQYIGIPIRIWDWAMNLQCRGFGPDVKPARLWVSPGRRVNYFQMYTTPRYWLQGGRLLTTINAQAATNPWLVTPGIVRDVEYPRVRSEPGSALTDARDILIEEVHCNADGSLSLRTKESSMADIWAAYSTGWREDQSRWLGYMEGVWAEEARQAAEDWDNDYNKRKEAWEGTHGEGSFSGKEDQPWW